MKMRLFTKTTIVIAVLVAVAVVGMSAALIYFWQAKRTIDDLISKNAGDMVVATELDIALLRQRGFIAAYILSNGDQKWLAEIERFEPQFRSSLDRFSKTTEAEGERALLARVGQAFNRYDAKRDEIVALYKQGATAEAKRAYLEELTWLYNDVAALCDEVVEINKQDIIAALRRGQDELWRLTYIMASSALLAAFLGAILIWFLARGIFTPLEHLTRDLSTFSAGTNTVQDPAPDDSIASLHQYLQALMTEVVKTRSDLETSHRELRHSERLAAIGKVVAHIAHEVRNPLASIGDFASAIESRPDNTEKIRNYARIINEEALRLERLLADVMKFSKPVRLERVPQSLNIVIQDTVDTFAQQIPERIALELSLDPRTPEVPIDAAPIKQVVINLVRNSIEAIQSDGKVRICTQPFENGAALIIQDDGPGISEEIQKQIFEPFFTTKKTGNGLGLAICHQIVTEHDGAIRLESAPGQGTTFSFTLPVAQEDRI